MKERILEEAERGEDVAVKAYKDALAQDLPSDLQSTVRLQYEQVQQAHNQVRALRDQTSTSSSTASYSKTV